MADHRIAKFEDNMHLLLREVRELVKASNQKPPPPKVGASPPLRLPKAQGTAPASSAGASAGGIDPAEVEKARAVLKRPGAPTLGKAFKTGRPRDRRR